MKEQPTAHYYRLPIETEAGGRLKALIDRGNECIRAASLLTEELGAKRFSTNEAFLIGGIGCLYFDCRPGSRTYEVLRRREGFFECIPNRSRQAGERVFQRIMQLPTVSIRELAPVFGDMKQGEMTPAFFDYRDSIYIRSDRPLPVEGLEETNEAVWAAMQTARKIVEKEKEQEKEEEES